MFPFLNILICACCQIWALGGWVLKGVVRCVGTVAGVCLLPSAGGSTEGSALRSASWELISSLAKRHLPRDHLLPKQLWIHFPSCCGGGQCAAWNFSFFLEQTFLWCYCIQVLGSSYFWRKAVYDSKVFLCSYHTGEKCCAVSFSVQGLKAADSVFWAGAPVPSIHVQVTLISTKLT